MSSYARLSKRPLLFKSFAWLDISEFDTISREIELNMMNMNEYVFPEGGGKEVWRRKAIQT
jgi:hypothetical protein